jgi:hypothetical protein
VLAAADGVDGLRLVHVKPLDARAPNSPGKLARQRTLQVAVPRTLRSEPLHVHDLISVKATRPDIL